jgi:hypothetical protein
MSLRDIASLGRLLAQFLSLFGDCFETVNGRRLLAAYVSGLLSNLQRMNVEAIALDQNIPPRTWQRFLESIKWDQEKLLRKCQKLVVKEFSDPEAIINNAMQVPVAATGNPPCSDINSLALTH